MRLVDLAEPSGRIRVVVPVGMELLHEPAIRTFDIPPRRTPGHAEHFVVILITHSHHPKTKSKPLPHFGRDVALGDVFFMIFFIAAAAALRTSGSLSSPATLFRAGMAERETAGPPLPRMKIMSNSVSLTSDASPLIRILTKELTQHLLSIYLHCARLDPTLLK